MKIAFLSFYSGSVERGVEVFVEELGKRLNRNHQISIFHTDFVAQSHTANKILKFIYLDSQSLKISWFTLKTLFKMLNKNFDFIISVNGGWQTLFCKFYSLFSGTKIIVSGQAGIGRDDKFNLWCNPDVFVALSERTLKWAKKINPVIKIVKIPNGVDLEKFKPQAKKMSLKLERPVILCVAALENYKRIDSTIKAVSKLDKGSLLLIGQGYRDYENYIDSLGKRLLGENRFLRLTVKHKDIPAYYSSADLFTMVSESQEAFGTVYVEAMACNLPVVARDDSLRREVIGQAGIFVKNPENANDYARCLELALKINFKDISRKQAEKFSWDKVVLAYEKLFQSLKQ